MKIKSLLLLLVFSFSFSSCEDMDDVLTEPMLIVKFRFDKNQERLNNIGQVTEVVPGNAAQSPKFNSISSHYIELAPNENTQIGEGEVLYHAPETIEGGVNAIDFSKAIIVKEGETFLKIPLKDIANGSYEWVRVSLSYQNYDIKILQTGIEYTGTLASFVGFNTYINTHYIGTNGFAVNANKLQGYWALAIEGVPFEGQAPEGATTVPNPIASTSPIPAGSCVVTGKFGSLLKITGNEKRDIKITLSLSINNSFEWQEVNADGKFEPGAGENVIDMGLRGLIPSYSVVY